jgi:hypothetical protein
MSALEVFDLLSKLEVEVTEAIALLTTKRDGLRPETKCRSSEESRYGQKTATARLKLSCSRMKTQLKTS